MLIRTLAPALIFLTSLIPSEAVPVDNTTSTASSAVKPYGNESATASQTGTSLPTGSAAPSSYDASSYAASPSSSASSSSTPTSSADPLLVLPTASSEYTTLTLSGPYSFSPQYATEETRGEGAWADAVAKARARISTWTLEQVVNITTGLGWQVGQCVGNIGAQPDVGFDGLCLQDSPTGVRFADRVSVFPAGINSASTFDRKLMRQRGLALGEEFRGKGVNIALGPGMNMARNAQGGRNWEAFGGDPFLAGEAAYETIKGLQTKGKGVQACAKHLIGNEQEHNRTTSSSNIDDRTMHEIYLHPFLKSVQADVASVMCSYNQVNQSWACQNSKVMNDLLKHELGFQGYVLSDWQATESGVAAIESGLDMTMPGDTVFNSGVSYFGQNLTDAVNNGTIPRARVNDMAVRILAGYYLVEQDDPDYPAVNFNTNNINDPRTNEHVDVRKNGKHAELIREIGAASTILLKNVNGALPLTNRTKTIAVIGNDAGPSSIGANGYADRGGDDGILAIGWGSGTANFPYLISPLEAIQAKAVEENQIINWYLDNFNTEAAAATAAYNDVALVFINSDSGEGYIVVDGNEGDRNNLTAWMNGDELVLAVAAQNNNTIVIIHSVGPIMLEPWIDHENITAVVYAGLPGEQAGNSLVDIIYGKVNPSGRLPFTIAKKEADYPTLIPFYPSGVTPQIDYVEALEIDYRHFLAKGITPRYPFGYGLSYTEFSYSNLQITSLSPTKEDIAEQNMYRQDATHVKARHGAQETIYVTKTVTAAGCATTSAGERNVTSVGKTGRSLWNSLHKPRWNVEFDITNSGEVNGHDIPQVYLAFPDWVGEPPKILKGFEKVWVKAGHTQNVTIPLSLYDLSYWDVTKQRWTQPQGALVSVIVAKDSFDDSQIKGTIQL
ncbi:glycoside hydrolase family 3 protein [Phaffia rhodozyma]|uniref:beta-glucosidase n=1 Tax=Phaffia rhodozyma TaxID=264483 RepID=A0A0F7SPA4_PHARH|nr:glycoside hydrolase family 3 protein [Phaffia rhodozyma]